MALYLLDLPRQCIPLEDLCFSLSHEREQLSQMVHQNYPREIEQFYEEYARQARPHYDPENNPILTIRGFNAENPSRSFYLSCVEFKDYHALKKLLYQHRHTDDLLLQQFVPLSMIAVLETADHYLVLGHRGGDHLPNRYLSPAGFHECPKTISPQYFSDKCKEEFREEIGFDFGGDITYIGLPGDTRDSFLDVSIFHGLTHMTREDIQEAWEENGSKDEHKHLIYIPSDPPHIARFLQGGYTGIVNPFKDITFEDGCCVRGPPEIHGKNYQQIENGVGSLVAYLSLKLPSQGLDHILESLVQSKIIEGFTYRNLSTSDSVYLL